MSCRALTHRAFRRAAARAALALSLAGATAACGAGSSQAEQPATTDGTPGQAQQQTGTQSKLGASGSAASSAAGSSGGNLGVGKTSAGAAGSVSTGPGTSSTPGSGATPAAGSGPVSSAAGSGAPAHAATGGGGRPAAGTNAAASGGTSAAGSSAASSAAGSGADHSAAGSGASASGSAGKPGSTSSAMPVYRIPLRLHVGMSELSDAELIPILEEVNKIWLTQAGICFEIEVTESEDNRSDGFDFRYTSGRIPSAPSANGVTENAHSIWSIDHPQLSAAPNPVMYPTARTTAHELGHALGLAHENPPPSNDCANPCYCAMRGDDCDDYLLRSGTKGFFLSPPEVEITRQRAAKVSLSDHAPAQCGMASIQR